MKHERPPPPAGRLLFRFEPDSVPGPPALRALDPRYYHDICKEYAVTAIDGEESLPRHVSIIIWGWIERTQKWEANVSARPVVFELLLMLGPGLSVRLPGDPEEGGDG